VPKATFSDHIDEEGGALKPAPAARPRSIDNKKLHVGEDTMETTRKLGPGARRAASAAFLASLAPAADAVAQEMTRVAPETVVTATRVPLPPEQVGSAVTVLEEDDLERRQTTHISDILREVPGVAVNRAGPVGSVTQVRLRGAEANQTVVLIDGIEVADPTNSEFNFADLLASDIERVEILRGPQSALWGADAIGGVVNIITKRGRDGFEAEGSVEAGSFNTVQSHAALRGGQEGLNGAVAVTHLRTDGTDISRGPGDDDGHENLTFSTTGGVSLLDNLEIEVAGRYIDSENEFDPQDFSFPATPTAGLVIDGDELQETEQLFGRIEAKLDLFDGLWQQRASLSASDVDKDFFSDGARTSTNKGRRARADYQSTFQLSTSELAEAEHTLILLAEREDERFENIGATPASPENQKRFRKSTGLVAEYRLGLFDRLFLSGAIREDINTDFQNATTWRATAAYVVEPTGTRLHGSYGKGVTNPTFFEQFGFFPGSFEGNPDLKPESSRGFDVGVEQPFFDGRVVLDVTYFRADLEDEIATIFDPGTGLLTVENEQGESERQGVEVSLNAEPLPGLVVDAAYTFTDSEDADGREEVRRPRHIASLAANQSFLDERASLGFTVRYNGEQEDSDFRPTTGDRVTLDDYALVDLQGRYRISDNAEIFGRIENLLDDRYEEVFSFRSSGLGAFAGIRVRFGPGG